MNSPQGNPYPNPNQVPPPNAQGGGKKKAFQHEDPELIRSLYIQKTTSSTPKVQKITKENKISLRSTSTKEHSVGVGLTRLFASIFGGIGATISNLFSPRSGVSKHNQCKIYGHVPPPPGTWHGNFPTCQKCGKEIKSLDELRSIRDQYSNLDRPKSH